MLLRNARMIGTRLWPMIIGGIPLEPDQSPQNFATHSWFAHQELRDSIVVHLWKEIAPTFRSHVEEAPERVDKIAGAMVLFRSGRGKAHL
jgi:hypothetical protein